MSDDKRDEVIRILQEQQKHGDYERAHAVADDALCSLLVSLGYKDVVEEYSKITKWCA
jgi:hypothetical protein